MEEDPDYLMYGPDTGDESSNHGANADSGSDHEAGDGTPGQQQTSGTQTDDEERSDGPSDGDTTDGGWGSEWMKDSLPTTQNVGGISA